MDNGRLSVLNYNLFFNRTKTLEPVVKYLVDNLNLQKEIEWLNIASVSTFSTVVYRLLSLVV